MSDRESLVKKVMVEADIGRGRLGVAILDPEIVQRPITLTMLTTGETRALVQVLNEAIAEADRDLRAERAAMGTEQYPGLSAAARKLSAQIVDEPWVVCVVVGAGEIVVHLKAIPLPGKLPAEIDGFPVVTRYHGPMATIGGPA